MYSIDRINGYPKIVDYIGTQKKVNKINKDEKNKQQKEEQQKRESFKDVFERTQTEDENK